MSGTQTKQTTEDFSQPIFLQSVIIVIVLIIIIIIIYFIIIIIWREKEDTYFSKTRTCFLELHPTPTPSPQSLSSLSPFVILSARLSVSFPLVSSPLINARHTS